VASAKSTASIPPGLVASPRWRMAPTTVPASTIATAPTAPSSSEPGPAVQRWLLVIILAGVVFFVCGIVVTDAHSTALFSCSSRSNYCTTQARWVLGGFLATIAGFIVMVTGVVLALVRYVTNRREHSVTPRPIRKIERE
jgi:uncharacterized membrane protein